jgi:hypothetical protein
VPPSAAPPDPLDAVPDPETVRLMLADATRRRDLLRSLLRVAVRKANYPRPTRRPAGPTPTPGEVARG